MPRTATTSSWPFPPCTQEVQLDEKGPFVAKKQQHWGPDEARWGDCWDHVASDPEHRLIVSAVVGKRTEDNARQLVYELRERTDGRFLNLITSDEYPAYATAIAAVYAPAQPSARGTPAPRRPPKERVYATARKTREGNRVVQVEARLVFGALRDSAAARCGAVLALGDTVFGERSNGTDRHRSSRTARKTYRFRKDGGCIRR